MSTRATITVIDEYTDLLNLYVHYDGYPANLGKRILDTLDYKGIAEAQDYACHLVKSLKTGVGDVYMLPRRQDEEYAYVLTFRDGKIMLTVFYEGDFIHYGTVETFAKYVQECIEFQERLVKACEEHA